MDRTAEDEFTAFVTQRGRPLLRVAFALTGDQHAAEDLVQSALAKAYVRWGDIQGDAEPYVKRIIYHESVSRWRRPYRRSEQTFAVTPDVTLAGDPEADVDLRLLVQQALLALPPRQRAVLVLRYLEDRTVHETADILGCRPGTVASQANRALAKLRELVPGLDHATDGTVRQ